MESCEYVCKNSNFFIKDNEKLDIKTYNTKFMNLDNDIIIKELNCYLKKNFYIKKMNYYIF